MAKRSSTSKVRLPVPREALLELGLTEDDIDEAIERAPLVCTNRVVDLEGAWFDVERVRRVLSALGSFKHTKGRWRGNALVPASWQVVWIIAPVFGWVRYDEELETVVRVIRAAWIEVPRKNGKSTISSGLALVLLLADREPGAEVYSAAASLPQAARVFDDAKEMARTSKAAMRRMESLTEVIRVPSTNGVFRALSRIAETAHGLNVHAGVVDEVHVHKKRDLIDAIETGTGARDQPLVIFITTADEGRDGTIYAEKHDYTRKVATGTVTDPTHYGVIWAAEPTDNPFVEATWRKANPGLGISPTLAYMRKEATRAKQTPSYFPTFCRLNLNLRMRAEVRWIPLKEWDANGGMLSDRDKLKGARAWGGLDLSSVSDLTAWLLVAESPQTGVDLEIFPRFYLPLDRVEDLERQLQVPLREWADQGFLTLTEGNTIDYDVVETDIVADADHFDLQTVGFDRMFAGQLVQRVDKMRGVELARVSQTFIGLSPGSKELERLWRDTSLVHGGNPVLRWHADSVEVVRDRHDNIKPVKPDRDNTTKRVDGIHALVMALDGYLRRPVKVKSKKRAAGF
jgi:phage terminase large subunit-like protein